MPQESKPLLPSPCKPGDRIAVVAPSSPFQVDRLHAGCELLRSWGLEPVYDAGILERWGYLAGSDANRKATLVEAFTRQDVSAVICARGGSGAVRLLEDLPWDQLAQHPKRFFGFSDISVLHSAMLQKLNWITFHSPMVASPLLYEGTQESQDRLKQALFGKTLEEICPPIPGTPWRPGKATGHLIGGNLALIVSLLGTPYQPDFQDAILVLEDIDEAPYRLDRMMQQLRLAGALDAIAGLGLGDFGGPLQDHYQAEDYEPHHFWMERLSLPGDCPILYNLPVGHTHENWTLPLGATATLDAHTGTLRIVS